MSAPLRYGLSWFIACPTCGVKKHRKCITLPGTRVRSECLAAPHEARKFAAREREANG